MLEEKINPWQYRCNGSHSFYIINITWEKRKHKNFSCKACWPKIVPWWYIFRYIWHQKRTYKFRFVSSGDSPKVLTVSLKGDSFLFLEDFKLNGTVHEPGTYYTWKYLGQDKIQIPDDQNMQIIINPHGNIMGPVSVFLEK